MDGAQSHSFAKSRFFFNQDNPIDRSSLISSAVKKRFLPLSKKSQPKDFSLCNSSGDPIGWRVVSLASLPFVKEASYPTNPSSGQRQNQNGFFSPQSPGGNTCSLLDLNLNNKLISRGQAIPQVPGALTPRILRNRLLLAGPVLPERSTV
jgi:hypothetical protein